MTEAEAWMKGPPPGRLWNYARPHLGLKSHFRHLGDGRSQPQIPAEAPTWVFLTGQILRVSSFCRVEWLVHSPARSALGVPRPFSDDALAHECVKNSESSAGEQAEAMLAADSASGSAQREPNRNPLGLRARPLGSPQPARNPSLHSRLERGCRVLTNRRARPGNKIVHLPQKLSIVQKTVLTHFLRGAGKECAGGPQEI